MTIELIVNIGSSSEVNHPLDKCLCGLGAIPSRVLSSLRKAVLDSIKFAPHVTFVLLQASRRGGISVEEDHGELRRQARVTQAGNGSAGMTGIHYRISEARPKRSRPDKTGRAAADTLTSAPKHAPVRRPACQPAQRSAALSGLSGLRFYKQERRYPK